MRRTPRPRRVLPGSADPLRIRRPRGRGVALLLAVAGTVAGCDDPVDERMRRLDAGRATWAASAPRDYAFEYRRSCFCPFVRTVRVEVGSGSIVRVIDVESSEPIPEERFDDFPTIEELFVELDQLIRGDPHLLEVEYDPTFGFPARVQVDIEERVADEEFSYTVTGFTAGQAGRRLPGSGARS